MARAHDDDDGDFEGDDPPTTAEPVRDDHHPAFVSRAPVPLPRAPIVPHRPERTEPIDKPDGDFDDDAHPTMIDPHVPTGGKPRTSWDPNAPASREMRASSFDRDTSRDPNTDDRRTADLSSAAQRALEPTADLGPAARRAFLDAHVSSEMPPVAGAISARMIDQTADLGPAARGTPRLSAPIPAVTASRRPIDPAQPRKPPAPTGPMLRPPPAPPSGAMPQRTLPGSQSAAANQRASAPTAPPPLRGSASGPQRAIPPSAPPPFITDRRAANTPPARIDDNSRTQRWEGKAPTAPPPVQPPLQYPQYQPPAQPMQAISHKTAEPAGDPRVHRPPPPVQLRAMSEVAKTPPRGMGRLAPPADPSKARARKRQDLMIWGSVVVITASIVTLVIWLIAR